jgi:hypothetical protein
MQRISFATIQQPGNGNWYSINPKKESAVEIAKAEKVDGKDACISRNST